ncbi:MAG TPA: phosphoribosyltransferase [Verrucomicrobia bacterium]|nr:MAG: hypothetical protein A2X46_05820 [Lentisphaerae bacterium GWF2_57_35]HBA82557.1 phosphoribosyltransferase [Verrucomicrobiota bacterium]
MSAAPQWIDCPDLRRRIGVFADRADAGARLAGLLEGESSGQPLLLAIPSGGIPVAIRIAGTLGLRLEAAVVSKIALPANSEAGYGAVAFDGTVELNEAFIRECGLSADTVARGIAQTREKVRRRTALFRADRPPLALTGESVVLIDDGLASGITMKAAVKAVGNQGAQRVIVAVPTGHDRSLLDLLAYGPQIFCANVRFGWSFAVADAYRQWSDVTEQEAAAQLKAFREKTGR